MINTSDIKNNTIRLVISATKNKYKLIESKPCLYYDNLMKKLLTTFINFFSYFNIQNFVHNFPIGESNTKESKLLKYSRS